MLRYEYQSVALRNAPAIFTDRTFARRFAARADKPSVVIMGASNESGGDYVVVMLADAARLLRAGFEAA